MARTKPKPPTDIRDVQVIKHDQAFFLSDRYGDVPENNQAALGLYYRDTRFLSRLELSVNDLAPLMLHSSTERNYSQIVELGYAVAAKGPSALDGRDNVSVSRQRVLGESLIEEIKVSSFSGSRQLVRLALAFDADFLDLFEVRGMPRDRSGELGSPEVRTDSVTFEYVGADDVVRATTVTFAPAPDELGRHEAVFEFDLPPKGYASVTVEVSPRIGEDRSRSTSYREARQSLEQDYSRWRKRCTRFRTPNVPLQQFLDRAILDLRMLLSE
ncbi:MAG: glycogen debranching N-terminal domain-containing protein, partial [Actinomycetota bacterium]